MKKINLANCSIEELWKYVATELAKNDVDVILVGGAVVSIYTILREPMFRVISILSLMNLRVIN